MEYIILGLLMLQPRTIYQLRKRINDGLNLMYSCSTGSIQAAIKKLLARGLVSVCEMTENGKLKKIYSITDSGKDCFTEWLNRSIDIGAPKNPELAKIYFLGFTESENRRKIIEKYIGDLKNTFIELEKICEEGESMSAVMQENDILYYQFQTAKYGRDFIKFNIGWYSRLLKSTEEQSK